MFRLRIVVLALAGFAVWQAVVQAKPQTPREALQPFNDLIGSWRGTGVPAGTKEEQQKGFWTETMDWGWKFRGSDAWIEFEIKDGKHFVSGVLRYVSNSDSFELTVKTKAKETLTFSGKLSKDKVLTLDREEKTEKQRLVLTMLHSNRFLLRYEVLPEGKTFYTRRYQIGATKEGVPFAAGDGRPECIVSGGLGTIAVSYKGQTYYVCCSGCRSEFNDDPEKYIKEYNEKKAKKK